MSIDGIPACPNCGRRPRKAIPAGTKAYAQGRRWYGYCAICAPEVEYERRKNLMRVSLEERELILELRRAEPAGRHHARPLWKGTGYMRKTTIGAVALGLALTACGSGVAAASQHGTTPQPQPAQKSSCVTYTLGWLTPTGHEADAPMTFCGTGARQQLFCDGNGPPGPGAVFSCFALPRGGQH